MIHHSLKLAPAILLLLLTSSCNSTTVRTTSVTPVMQGDSSIPEQQLLDVGIELFNPGLDNIEEDDLTAYPEVRLAEARYIPYQLMETMQASANWGAVRIVPKNTSSVDVVVAGDILHSDGESMSLFIKVSDATGLKWFERHYVVQASKYSYQAGRNHNLDPFQDIYNRIANDIARYREQLSQTEVKTIRSVAELRFAETFSPEAFGGYLETDKKGIYSVRRLPADNDPMMERIGKIRERDYLYIDTLQDYYGSFVREMEQPYQDWRANSYEEVLAYRELRSSSRKNAAAGAAAMLAGILAASSSSGSVRAAGGAAMVGGGYLIKSAMDKHVESSIHAEALQELGASMSAEVGPQIIELEDRTVTLTGTAQDQYEQWRVILRDIYASEIGDIGISESDS
jgi:hypothetical protein